MVAMGVGRLSLKHIQFESPRLKVGSFLQHFDLKMVASGVELCNVNKCHEILFAKE